MNNMDKKTEFYNLIKKQYEDNFLQVNGFPMNRKQRKMMEAELKKMVERRFKHINIIGI